MIVNVVYRHEGDSWWADSVDVPGYTAVGDSLEEVWDLVRSGLPLLLEREALELREMIEGWASPPSVARVTSTLAEVSSADGRQTSGGSTIVAVQFVPARTTVTYPQQGALA